MYCKRCDKYLEPNETVCPTCGTKVKLKKIMKIVYISLAATIALVAGIILLWKNYSVNKEREALNNQKVEVTNINKENYITFGQYTFKLVDGLHYSNNENYIYAATSDLNVSFKMNIVTASYVNIKEKYKDFVESMIESGVQVVSYYVTSFDNQEYILIAAIQDNKNCIYAITELNSETIVQSIVESKNNSGYEAAFYHINNIMKDYIKVNFNLDKEYTSTLNDFLNVDKSTNINLGDLFKVQ